MIGGAQPDILGIEKYSSNDDCLLVNSQFVILRIAIEIVDLPVRHGDFQ